MTVAARDLLPGDVLPGGGVVAFAPQVGSTPPLSGFLLLTFYSDTLPYGTGIVQIGPSEPLAIVRP